MTLAAGGGLVILAPELAVAQGAGRPHSMLSLAERRRYAEARKHFYTALRAFNEINSVPIEQSALWQALDPDVEVYDFDSGNQLMARGLKESVNYFYNKRPEAKFEPKPESVRFHLHSQPQTVTGTAYWTGNDGAGTEKIFFTWELKDHLISSMKGHTEPPVA